MGSSFVTGSPTPVTTQPASRPRPPSRLAILVQGRWSWFDRLNDLQTVAFLSAMLVSLLVVAVGLLRFGLTGAPPPLIPARVTPQADAAPTPLPAVLVAPTPLASPVPRAQTAPVRVNLRSEPSTEADVLGTLAPSTTVQLIGDPTYDGGIGWQQIRTDRGQEGWIIVGALE